jgi:hypothetical protein
LDVRSVRRGVRCIVLFPVVVGRYELPPVNAVAYVGRRRAKAALIAAKARGRVLHERHKSQNNVFHPRLPLSVDHTTEAGRALRHSTAVAP